MALFKQSTYNRPEPEAMQPVLLKKYRSLLQFSCHSRMDSDWL